MRRVAVYERKGTIFVSAESLTEEGVWIANGDYAALPATADAAAIGAMLTSAGVASRTDVPHPVGPDSRAPIRALLEMAGVKGWSAFARNARNVDVIFAEADEIRITPYRRTSVAGGFEPVPGAEVVLEGDVSTSAVGSAVRAALVLCGK